MIPPPPPPPPPEGGLLFDPAPSFLHRQGDGRVRDPRYLKEMALHILDGHIYDAEGVSQVGGFPPMQRAFEFLDEAEEAIKGHGDVALAVQIANIRLNSMVELQKEKDESIKRAYKRLVDLVSSEEPREDAWPPFILDTIAWAEWSVPSIRPAAEDSTTRVQRLLRTAMRADGLEEAERRVISSHQKAIRDSIKSRLA